MPYLRTMLLFLALLGGLAALTAAKEPQDPYCGMLPEAVTASSVYAGWSACKMKTAGERPLWNGLAAGERQVMRFIFTQGHGMFYRVIRIVEEQDGTVTVRVSGTHNRNHYKKPERPVRDRSRKLSPEEWSTITRLANESGVWEFDVGTWDGTGDDADIYMHCQILEMEKAMDGDYRFSSVNIGCNQPAKLMPLVREVVRLGGMKNTHNGMLFE